MHFMPTSRAAVQKGGQDMRAVFFVGAAMVLSLISTAAPQFQSAPTSDPKNLPGLWFGTVFFGDPASPSTPKEQFVLTVHQEGTYMIDSTAETGTHPLNLGKKTPEQGVWQRQGRVVRSHGYW